MGHGVTSGNSHIVVMCNKSAALRGSSGTPQDQSGMLRVWNSSSHREKGQTAWS